jgi:hypothetical protein
MDLTSGYNQLKMSQNSKKYTAFITHRGTFRFKRMPFGLCNAIFFFQKCIERIPGNVLYKFAVAFQDDVTIYSNNMSDHFSI